MGFSAVQMYGDYYQVDPISDIIHITAFFSHAKVTAQLKSVILMGLFILME